MNKFRHACITQPELAKSRADLCWMYRDMRAMGKGAVARRLFVRMRVAIKITKEQLDDRLYHSTFPTLG